MSGHCHSLAALSMGKRPPVGWAQKPVWKLWRKEKSLAPGGMKHDSYGHVACNLVSLPPTVFSEN